MLPRKKSKGPIQCSSNARNVLDENENSAISMLTDDCLMHVFSLLPVRDRVRIQRVCKRWQTLGLLPWHDFKKMSVNYALFTTEKKEEKVKNPVQVLKQILTLCGPCLTTVEFGYSFLTFINSTDLIKLITKMCPNVRSLDMKYSTLTPKGLELLASNYTNLTEINVGECWKGCKDLVSKLFSVNKRLRTVKISSCQSHGNNKIDGKCLLSLNPESVQRLVINDTRKISVDHLVSVLQHLRKIRVLSLHEDYGSDVSKLMYKVDDILKQIPVKSSLEEIRLRHCTQRLIIINNIANFVNLKKLILYGHSFVNNKNLSILAKYCKSLRHVSLQDSNQVTDKGWRELVKGLKLEELDIYRLRQITDKSFSYVPETLMILICHQCDKLTNQSFSSIVRTAKNLERLEVKRCNKVDVDVLIDDAVDAKKLLSDNRLELRIERQKNARPITDISPQLRLIEDLCPHYGF